MGAADDGEAEGALRLGLDGLARAGAGGAAGLCLLRPDLPELFRVGEDNVHMLGPGCQHGGPLSDIRWRRRTLSKASIWPVICLPSMSVTLIRQLIYPQSVYSSSNRARVSSGWLHVRNRPI